MAIQVGWRCSNLEFGLGVELAGAGKPALVQLKLREMAILRPHLQPLIMMRQTSKLIASRTAFYDDCSGGSRVFLMTSSAQFD